ncbi:MAG: extracellular solute-binding protein [Pseudomonadota bacterium]
MLKYTTLALGSVGAAALMTALTAGTASAQAAPDCPSGEVSLTIVSWGGAYEESQRKAYYDPFMAACPNVTIVQESASNEAVAKLRAQAEANNTTWDVVDVVASDAIRLCDEGLALEIDPEEWLREAPDGTSAEDDFGDLLVTDCFIPQIVYSTTFGYRTDVEAWGGEVPEDICAIFDLESFPGTRSLESRPINNLEWALFCDGVAKEDIYDVLETDEGQARAFAKLDTIKDSTIWWSAGAETPQRLADGEAVIGSTYNGRLFSLIEEQDQPVAMLWDMQVFDLDGWVIPAGVDDDEMEAIRAFIAFATDTQRLADQAKFISYGPARASSAPLVSTHAELGIDMAPHMPTDPDNSANTLLYNYEWWADYRDDLDAKFQAWLTQ